MSVNEVVVNGVTELSLVNDTVSETSLLEGETAHAASGEQIIGKAKYINPNLLINPDFSTNQRGQKGEFNKVGEYFVDGWILDSGFVTINADGSILLNGTISQKLEISIGDVFTAQASAGTATYDDDNKVFSVSAVGETIRWAKLEVGLVTTPFVKPNPAVELVKCQRFYIPASLVGLASSMNSNNLYFFVPLPVEMRVTPSLQNAELAVLNRKNNARLDLTGWTIAIYASVRNGVLLAITKASHGLDVNDYVAQLTAGGLSAEL